MFKFNVAAAFAATVVVSFFGSSSALAQSGSSSTAPITSGISSTAPITSGISSTAAPAQNEWDRWHETDVERLRPGMKFSISFGAGLRKLESVQNDKGADAGRITLGLEITGKLPYALSIGELWIGIRARSLFESDADGFGRGGGNTPLDQDQTFVDGIIRLESTKDPGKNFVFYEATLGVGGAYIDKNGGRSFFTLSPSFELAFRGQNFSWGPYLGAFSRVGWGQDSSFIFQGEGRFGFRYVEDADDALLDVVKVYALAFLGSENQVQARETRLEEDWVTVGAGVELRFGPLVVEAFVGLPLYTRFKFKDENGLSVHDTSDASGSLLTEFNISFDF